MRGRRPTSLKGTRDFEASQILRRHYIFETIRRVYQKYGFLPLETPALEHLTTLMGKYGEEGDQLLFKVLDSGDFLADIGDLTKGYRAVLPRISSKGLRYDLTVPLMRYVAMNSGELTFPFKRYQMQPVWRADRPQKGRYREFYQCDIDVVGTSSLLCEAEILVIIQEVLLQLGIKDFTIYINHRHILRSLAALAGVTAQEEALCMALDKLAKVGKDKVLEELSQKGFPASALSKLAFIFDLPAAQAERWALLTERLGHRQAGMQAIQTILDYVRSLGIEEPAITLDPTLARGLSYYTGALFEVKIKHLDEGSLGGGGRYDGLTDAFGLPGVSGVGFSFGLDRLYTALEALALFPPQSETTTRVMLTNLGQPMEAWGLQVLATLRSHDIYAEIYPEVTQLKKQLRYAHKRDIPSVAIIGETEQTSQMVALKNMHTGTQRSYSLKQLVTFLRPR